MKPKQGIAHQWLCRLLAWSYGAVFLWAGVLKVREPAAFLQDIRGYRLLPDPFAAWLALGLPWLEIFAGLAVVTGWMRKGGLLLLNGALVLFAFALVSAWMRGLDIECGCLGGSSKGSTSLLIAIGRDAVLLSVGLWLAQRTQREGELAHP